MLMIINLYFPALNNVTPTYLIREDLLCYHLSPLYNYLWLHPGAGDLSLSIFTQLIVQN